MSSRIGLLGVGKIGRALMKGLLDSHAPSELKLFCFDPHSDGPKAFASYPNVASCSSNEEVVASSEIILLCVKPFQAKKVLENLAPHLSSEKLLISICASITLAQLHSWSGGQCRILRAMPNLPVTVGSGITVLSRGSSSSADDLRRGLQIFSNVGSVVELEEQHLDSVTALSGSGPAFMFYFMEALSEAGAQLGIPKEHAFALVFHTMRGSAELCLKTNLDPQELIQQVATPGGCTVEGLKAFAEKDIRQSLIDSVKATAKRAEQLRNES